MSVSAGGWAGSCGSRRDDGDGELGRESRSATSDRLCAEDAVWGRCGLRGVVVERWRGGDGWPVLAWSAGAFVDGFE